MEDTIVALATAMGEASIHILRLSGPKTLEIVTKHFVPRNNQRWELNANHTLHLGTFADEKGILDEVLIGRMLAPYSFTGEDVLEINCHGGPWVAQQILECCIHSGARLAEPGEFTKRAFLNGKLDLIQAEAIIDLIKAQTESAGRLALTQLRGGLSEKIIELKDRVLEILAFIEAGIDFPEDDVEDLDRNTLINKLQNSLQTADNLLIGSKTGKILREGLATVIAGLPNVGKSSLLNALLREERAIVTDIPGTTRDEIREAINIGGILLQLVDTAGIRESDDPVERLGIQRTWRALENADLVLLVVDANDDLSPEEERIISEYSDKVIILANKTDLIKDDHRLAIINNMNNWIPFSVIKHEGFEILEKEIKDRVFHGQTVRLNDPMLSNVRQIAALDQCCVALAQALDAARTGMPWDILSIDVRTALQEISAITGDNVQESLLETIFSRFCIGK